MMHTLVHLKLACFVCGDSKSEPRNLWTHLLASHSLDIPTRSRSMKRFDTDEYIYIKKLGEKHHDELQEHYECPSCLFHCEDLADLKKHVSDTHLRDDESIRKRDATGLQDDNGDKLPSHEKRYCARKDSVSISNNSNTITTFHKPSSQSIDRPKMTKKTIQALEDIVNIVAPYNINLPQHLSQTLKKYESDQTTLKFLKMFPIVHAMLLGAVDQSLEDLPTWTWTYTYPKSVSTREMRLLRTLQFVLTGFADRSRNPYQHETRYERSYFVKYVVPILQTFGQQTGCLKFEWCEVSLKQFSRWDMTVNLWTSPAIRYVDGLGYDTNGEERLVIEASSNQQTENLKHTLDDTAKQIHAQYACYKESQTRIQTPVFLQ